MHVPKHHTRHAKRQSAHQRSIALLFELLLLPDVRRRACVDAQCNHNSIHTSRLLSHQNARTIPLPLPPLTEVLEVPHTRGRHLQKPHHIRVLLHLQPPLEPCKLVGRRLLVFCARQFCMQIARVPTGHPQLAPLSFDGSVAVFRPHPPRPPPPRPPPCTPTLHPPALPPQSPPPYRQPDY